MLSSCNSNGVLSIKVVYLQDNVDKVIYMDVEVLTLFYVSWVTLQYIMLLESDNPPLKSKNIPNTFSSNSYKSIDRI